MFKVMFKTICPILVGVLMWTAFKQKVQLFEVWFLCFIYSKRFLMCCRSSYQHLDTTQLLPSFVFFQSSPLLSLYLYLFSTFSFLLHSFSVHLQGIDFLLPSFLLRFIIKSSLLIGSTPIYSLLVTDSREKNNPYYYKVFFYLTFASVSFCSCSNSTLFHPVFTKVELMSSRSLILIFKWMMKKATARWSIGQPWLYWQRPVWLQSRVLKCNPLLVPLVSRSSGGRVGMELSFVSFSTSTQNYTLVNAQRHTKG